MTAAEERYIHFISCLDSLNECWFLLCSLRDHRDNQLRGAAFRFSLVLYAKPYRESRGTTTWRHRLDTTYVPMESLELHEQILRQRDQIHAHTDISVLDAQLTVHEFEKKTYALIMKRHMDATDLMPRSEEIIQLVEGTLDRMYVQAKRLEASLPR